MGCRGRPTSEDLYLVEDVGRPVESEFYYTIVTYCSDLLYVGTQILIQSLISRVGTDVIRSDSYAVCRE